MGEGGVGANWEEEKDSELWKSNEIGQKLPKKIFLKNIYSISFLIYLIHSTSKNYTRTKFSWTCAILKYICVCGLVLMHALVPIKMYKQWTNIHKTWQNRNNFHYENWQRKILTVKISACMLNGSLNWLRVIF